MSNAKEKYINPFTDFGFKRLFGEEPNKDVFFEKAFEKAKFTSEEFISYEDSLKYYRDLKNSLDTARDERTLEIAISLLKNGADNELISKSTGLSLNEIEKLRNL